MSKWGTPFPYIGNREIHIFNDYFSKAHNFLESVGGISEVNLTTIILPWTLYSHIMYFYWPSTLSEAKLSCHFPRPSPSALPHLSGLPTMKLLELPSESLQAILD